MMILTVQPVLQKSYFARAGQLCVILKISYYYSEEGWLIYDRGCKDAFPDNKGYVGSN